MADVVVSLALQTFKDLLLDEGKFLAGVEGEAKELEFQLKDIQGLLEDADRKKQNSAMVQRWIEQIRDLSYRAEDTITSYAIRNSSETQSRGLKRLLSRLKSNAVSCFSLHELGQEISEIKSELERVSKNMRDNGIIKKITDEAETSSAVNQDEDWARKTFPNFEIGECFVGKEKDLELLCSLVQDDKQHRIISVWGMGGLGKSTIVKQVYNRMKKTKNFDRFAWVCITQHFQIRTVLESVFKQLDKKEEDISSLSKEQLIGKLCKVQRVKRCLIVVDDLWEVSHWYGLKHAFVAEDLKSKILMTTRNKNVAEIGYPIELGLLNKEEALELLLKKSFPQGNYPDSALKESFDKICEEMVDKCGCLPLAISLLGGVLSKKSSMAEWKDVNSNIDSSVYGGDGREGSQIEKVLHLSYQDLPYYLKACFLLLARWREGKLISTLQLYWLWIGQGMISYRNVKQKDETLLETAEIYLSELASRSLVKLEDDSGSTPLVKYKFCRLHDKVRELCVSIGANEKYGVLVSEYTDGKFNTLPHEDNRTRHLVMNFKEKLQLVDVDPVAMASGEGSKHLRSLEIQNDMLPEFPCPGQSIGQSIVDLRKFKMLKSLIISNFKFKKRKFPSGITTLIHLKNLCLEYCEFDELPSSIGLLVYLEYLSLCGSWNVRIPNELNKLSQLKHLNLPPYDSTIGNYRMSLDVSNTLEFLEGFDSLVHELESITRMKNLRTFSAISRDNGSLSTIINIIATEWKKLRYCKVSIQRDCELRSGEGKKKLKQVLACPNLYNLAIEVPLWNHLAEFESDIISTKLMCLNLKDCEIEDNPWGILGKIASLKELTLSRSSFTGEELICPALSFPSLRKLKLAYLPNWRELRVENGAMPYLREIHIKKCPNLKKIPNGLSCISALQHLTITGMPELGSRVKVSGEDYQKVCRIPSVFTRE